VEGGVGIHVQRSLDLAVKRYFERLSRGPRHFVLLGLTAAIALTLAGSIYGQRPSASEYQVKAAYLYNFGKFVTWPETPATKNDQLFEICVLGEDPFGSTLESTIADQTIGGKGIVARRITKAQGIDSCRILFISSSEIARLPEIIDALEKTSVLTVSDIPEFSQHGGMIQFVFDGNRVRFEVNLTKAEDAGLNLSSALLKVAVRVTRIPHPGM